MPGCMIQSPALKIRRGFMPHLITQVRFDRKAKVRLHSVDYTWHRESHCYIAIGGIHAPSHRHLGSLIVAAGCTHKSLSIDTGSYQHR